VSLALAGRAAAPRAAPLRAVTIATAAPRLAATIVPRRAATIANALRRAATIATALRRAATTALRRAATTVLPAPRRAASASAMDLLEAALVWRIRSWHRVTRRGEAAPAEQPRWARDHSGQWMRKHAVLGFLDQEWLQGGKPAGELARGLFIF
jgi:hypothetical protein